MDGNRRNPRLDNLAYGTRNENSADRDRHGTMCRGSRIGTSKLTESQVADIRRRRAMGESQRLVSQAFGVSMATIYYIDHNIHWRHVKVEAP